MLNYKLNKIVKTSPSMNRGPWNGFKAIQIALSVGVSSFNAYIYAADSKMSLKPKAGKEVMSFIRCQCFFM